MFKNFEKAANTKEEKTGGPGVNQGIPSEEEMKGFEKNFMGMFESMAKQLENLGDDYGDEDMPDDEAMKEAEKMMKQVFGNLSGGG